MVYKITNMFVIFMYLFSLSSAYAFIVEVPHHTLLYSKWLTN